MQAHLVDDPSPSSECLAFSASDTTNLFELTRHTHLEHESKLCTRKGESNLKQRCHPNSRSPTKLAREGKERKAKYRVLRRNVGTAKYPYRERIHVKTVMFVLMEDLFAHNLTQINKRERSVRRGTYDGDRSSRCSATACNAHVLSQRCETQQRKFHHHLKPKPQQCNVAP
jgi:hypothetical protein